MPLNPTLKLMGRACPARGGNSVRAAGEALVHRHARRAVERRALVAALDRRPGSCQSFPCPRAPHGLHGRRRARRRSRCGPLPVRRTCVRRARSDPRRRTPASTADRAGDRLPPVALDCRRRFVAVREGPKRSRLRCASLLGLCADAAHPHAAQEARGLCRLRPTPYFSRRTLSPRCASCRAARAGPCRRGAPHAEPRAALPRAWAAAHSGQRWLALVFRGGPAARFPCRRSPPYWRGDRARPHRIRAMVRRRGFQASVAFGPGEAAPCRRTERRPRRDCPPRQREAAQLAPWSQRVSQAP